MDIFFFFLLLILLVLSSGFFSASETALFSLPSTKIKAYLTGNDPRRRLIAKLVLEPRDLLVTVFMLNTLVNILIQNTTSDLLGHEGKWILKVGIPFLLMFFLGEIIPKYIGLQNNVVIADKVIESINFMQNAITPIRKFIIGITLPISRYMFFFLKKEKNISKDEIKHVLNTSKERGVLDLDEADILWGYMHLQEVSVQQLMQPREDILFYNIEEPLSKLIHLFADQECSRIPVCDKTLDDILGLISAKDFFLHAQEITNSQSLIPFLSRPLYIPETSPAMILGKQLEEHNQIIALAVDEYGSLSGLISQEDLIEEVIGEISDLRDAKKLFTIAGPNAIIASGRLPIEDFNEFFHCQLESKTGMLTISGWLLEKLQDIPKSGLKIELDDFLFQILAADSNRIRRLYIQKMSKKNKSSKRL